MAPRRLPCCLSGHTHLCPPKTLVCPGGCQPGFCLNTQCPFHTRPEVVLSDPEDDRQADLQRLRIEQALQEQRRTERRAFMDNERKIIGMTFLAEDKRLPSWYHEEKKGCSTNASSHGMTSVTQPVADNKIVQLPQTRRQMRGPARRSCMLDIPKICHPLDDYSQLSLFMRTSTMPCYGRNDTVSETRDSFNLSVWNNCKDQNRQIYKLRRDWLSNWGELYFKDQRWRKAWQEKLAAGGT